VKASLPADEPDDFSGSGVLSSEPPLFVGMDGTLLRTSVLFEHLAAALRANPLRTLFTLLLILKGLAAFKRALCELGPLPVGQLPMRQRFCRWLTKQHAQGREIILTTAADSSTAKAVANELGVFSAVIASDGVANNGGARKLGNILSRVEQGPFDYCGSKRADLPIMAEARRAIVVGADQTIALTAQREGNADLRFVVASAPHQWRYWMQAIRPFHWLKNLLVMVPFFTEFLVTETSALLSALMAAIAMCLAASAGYLINDLLDLQADRAHPRKRSRPFAAGRLTAAQGMGGALLMLSGSAILGWLVSPVVLLWIVVYLVGTFSYSMVFKREPIVDVAVLSALHTIRIIVGAAAVQVEMSFWLLAFSLFFFFSLASMKRCGELITRRERGEQTTRGRGYRVVDLAVLQPIGVAAGIAAVLVLALYVHDPQVIARYPIPEALWLALVALLVWTARAWFDTARGLMLDDPLLYAMRHRRGRLLLLLIAASFGIASLWGLGGDVAALS
jgi:4-hydroxybenzoate polyprenyltransferase